jgi:hypothetical protein
MREVGRELSRDVVHVKKSFFSEEKKQKTFIFSAASHCVAMARLFQPAQTS